VDNQPEEATMKISTRVFDMLRMIGGLRNDLPLLMRLLRAWKAGVYRGLSPRTVLACIGALVYLVSPVDLVPDFIPGIGFLDDAVVLGLVLQSLAQDLAAYRVWEQGHSNG
jgi:uncharacterized membrane protein YkvA (DUF1232 family)